MSKIEEYKAPPITNLGKWFDIVTKEIASRDPSAFKDVDLDDAKRMMDIGKLLNERNSSGNR